MNSSDTFNRGDCVVCITDHDFRIGGDTMYCHFYTRFLYGKILENAVGREYIVAYKYTYFGESRDGLWSNARHSPKWKRERTDRITRIPDYCWLNDEKTAIFLKLQGLGTEFGLL